VEHVDVIIVGAGLSGIGAACHLKMECPQKSFILLEAREAIGGTWDLFRYPGVRSDSDMYTLIEVNTDPDGSVVRFSCNFLYLCTGYYDYENGYTPQWPGIESAET